MSLGIPVDSEEGRETWCHDDGRHSATGGPFGPYAWISTRPNGSTHLVAWNGPGALHQLTGGRRSVADPAFRPAAPVMLHGLADAAHDLDLAVKAAHAWYLANGTLAGADESATGLISFESSLCLVSAAVRSQANSSTCTSGAGTGSTSVYADEGEVALARDTGVGICLYSKYWTFGSIRLSTVGLTTTADDCRGEDARAAAQVSW